MRVTLGNGQTYFLEKGYFCKMKHYLVPFLLFSLNVMLVLFLVNLTNFLSFPIISFVCSLTFFICFTSQSILFNFPLFGFITHSASIPCPPPFRFSAHLFPSFAMCVPFLHPFFALLPAISTHFHLTKLSRTC